jgi:hypothetical protein
MHVHLFCTQVATPRSSHYQTRLMHFSFLQSCSADCTVHAVGGRSPAELTGPGFVCIKYAIAPTRQIAMRTGIEAIMSRMRCQIARPFHISDDRNAEIARIAPGHRPVAGTVGKMTTNT